MKVEVIKSFVSGRYAGTKGETQDMPEEAAGYLTEIGFVAPVQQEEEPEKPEDEEPEGSEGEEPEKEQQDQPEVKAPKRTRKAAK